jgi:hypothetical protein
LDPESEVRFLGGLLSERSWSNQKDARLQSESVGCKFLRPHVPIDTAEKNPYNGEKQLAQQFNNAQRKLVVEWQKGDKQTCEEEIRFLISVANRYVSK